MLFLHPEILWLAPLVAAPILIHLLNRLRYRRVRWAAIDFLLASEKRAVRRARLRHLLLMALRTLLLVAALLALAQPVFRGRLSALLGGSTQVAVLLDSSASMSATDPVAGPSFHRARGLVERGLADQPAGCRAVVATFDNRYHSPFNQPLLDRQAALAELATARCGSARANVPAAILRTAESLQRGGGGGTIWLLTNLHADGWRRGESGVWQEVRAALKNAGNPRVVITDVAPAITSNLAIADVRVEAASVDSVRLDVTVELHGQGSANTTLSLFLDEQAQTADGAAPSATGTSKQIASRQISLSAAGTTHAVFDVKMATDRAVTGWFELTPDAMPADDRFYFLLTPKSGVPVLVVDGAPSATLWEGGGDYIVEALAPLQLRRSGRATLAPQVVRAADLAGTKLVDYAAVVLAELPAFSPELARSLRDYVAAGGLLICFPGGNANIESWNQSGLFDVRLAGIESFESMDTCPHLLWASPKSPTDKLKTAYLDRVRINRIHKIEMTKPVAQPFQAGDKQAGKPVPPQVPAEVLITAGLLAKPDGPAVDMDRPFLVRMARGRGKVYLFAVSGRRDFSELPTNATLLLTLQAAVGSHLTDGETLSSPAGEPLRLAIPPGGAKVLLPTDSSAPAAKDDNAVPLSPLADNPNQAEFIRTEQPGLYRLLPSQAASVAAAAPIAAVNAAPEESSLDRIAPGDIRELLRESPIYFTSGSAELEQSAGDGSDRVSASGFPLAMLAILLVLSEVMLGWSIGRPMKAVV